MDVPTQIEALYEQQRNFEEQHGPRIREIRARDEMLRYLVKLLGQPAVQAPNALTFLSSIGSIPLVRDDELPEDIVRLVHADHSRRDVFVPYVPLPVLPPRGEVDA